MIITIDIETKEIAELLGAIQLKNSRLVNVREQTADDIARAISKAFSVNINEYLNKPENAQKLYEKITEAK